MGDTRTNKSYDDAIKKIWDYLNSDEFVSVIKERKKYDDLSARLRMAECVLRDHGVFEEYQKMWMGKEDE